jgi:hypothetical protein
MVNVFTSISITVLAVGDEQGLPLGNQVREVASDSYSRPNVPINVILKLEKKQFQVNEQINIDLRLENNSEDDISLQPFDNVLFKRIGNDDRPRQPASDLMGWENAIFEMGNGGVLAKGGYIGLKKFGGFTFQKPGKFVLWLTHFAPGCPVGIRSNPLRFTITK